MLSSTVADLGRKFLLASLSNLKLDLKTSLGLINRRFSGQNWPMEYVEIIIIIKSREMGCDTMKFTSESTLKERKFSYIVTESNLFIFFIWVSLFGGLEKERRVKKSFLWEGGAEFALTLKRHFQSKAVISIFMKGDRRHLRKKKFFSKSGAELGFFFLFNRKLKAFLYNKFHKRKRINNNKWTLKLLFAEFQWNFLYLSNLNKFKLPIRKISSIYIIIESVDLLE